MRSKCHSIRPLIAAGSVLDSEGWTTSDHQMQARIQRSQRGSHHIERIAGPANIPDKINSQGLSRFDVDASELTASCCRTANINFGMTRQRLFVSCVFRASLWMVRRQLNRRRVSPKLAASRGKTIERAWQILQAKSAPCCMAPGFGET